MIHSLKQNNVIKYGFLKTNHMNELKEIDSDYSDVTLVCDDHERQAHKVILGC